MITSNASLNKLKQERSKLERTLAIFKCWVGVLIMFAVYMLGSFILHLQSSIEEML